MSVVMLNWDKSWSLWVCHPVHFQVCFYAFCLDDCPHSFCFESLEGAGKTTLLNVLSQRQGNTNLATLRGDILVNGSQIDDCC